MMEDESQQSFHSQTAKPLLALAPFPVWVAMRVFGLVGSAIMLWWILRLFSFAVAGTPRPSYWILIIGVVTGTSSKHMNSWEIDLPDFWDGLGSRLASKFCPSCGQSVFDKMPARGFELEAARHSFWPARICHGCGNDLSRSGAPDRASDGG